MTAARVKNGTATTTASTVTLDADYARVEVLNRDASNEIHFTVDGSAAVVDGDNTFVCPPKGWVSVEAPAQDTTDISVITNASTAKYSVSGDVGYQYRRGAAAG